MRESLLEEEQEQGTEGLDMDLDDDLDDDWEEDLDVPRSGKRSLLALERLRRN